MTQPADEISGLKVVELASSRYLKPLRLQYTINQIQKNWDLLQVHNSVSILIYNKTRDVVVLVKQFRPSTYLGIIPNLSVGMEIDTEKYPVSAGYTIELCAGIVDKDIPLEDVAREEVLEECGYDVPSSRLKKIFTFRGVGVMGNTSHLFYLEVEDKEKLGKGGGLRTEGEFIQVIEMPRVEFKAYIDSVDLVSPAGLAAAAQWFFANVRH